MTNSSPITFIKANAEDVPAKLSAVGISSGHFTNGVYSYAPSLVVPTVLAGFQYAVDKAPAADNSVLIIAVNSDKSMVAAMDKKNATPAERAALESEEIRARRVAEPLALQNPGRKIVVIYYDEETPNKLYSTLSASGFGMQSLFKWGYGTNPQAGVIEGAEHFNVVRGHPLPNDIKPVFTELTRKTGQKGSIEVVDLRGTHISPDNKVLFRVLDAVLLPYAAQGNGSRPSAGQPSPPK